jgi:hypothetical protein
MHKVDIIDFYFTLRSKIYNSFAFNKKNKMSYCLDHSWIVLGI